MSEIRLTTPEGYFEKSMERTMASVNRINRRRKAVAGGFAALALLVGVFYTALLGRYSAYEKEYYAMEAEMAQLDVFLEINQ